MSTTAKVYKKLIWQDPERVSGAPCFYGTRVPVSHLFDYLEDGVTLEAFAAKFKLPVKQVVGVLEVARKGLDRELQAA